MTDQNETPFEAQAGEGPDIDLHAVIGGLQTQIDELQKQLEQAKNDKLLALAEAENSSKRADRRIADNAKYATSNICKTLLQVADNLGRALLAAPADQRVTNEPLKNLAVGVELTEKELLKVLEDQGVKRVNALNAPFDPNLHNAVQEQENATVPAGTVLQVFVEGYTMHDRLLRPAMVVVSRGGPKRDATKPDAASQGGVNTSV
ncbi:MAG: nucleotide exchange factor GrpE [Rhodospirillaceae bacterium]|nr:nucleotide exchange factor GrpE [Rhodospirillaceae bacterium]